MSLPKYFDNLHLVQNSISGSISIANVKLDANGRGCSDKQKDVTDEFWNIVTMLNNDLEDNSIEVRKTPNNRLAMIFVKASEGKHFKDVLMDRFGEI